MTDEARRPQASAAQRGGPGRAEAGSGRGAPRSDPPLGGRSCRAAPGWPHRPGVMAAPSGRLRPEALPLLPTAVTAAGLGGASTPAAGQSPGDTRCPRRGVAALWSTRIGTKRPSKRCPPQHRRAASPPGPPHRGRAGAMGSAPKGASPGTAPPRGTTPGGRSRPQAGLPFVAPFRRGVGSRGGGGTRSRGLRGAGGCSVPWGAGYRDSYLQVLRFLYA